MYLPFGRDQLTMVGVAGYPAPFHEIEIGVGIIGRAAATPADPVRARRPADPDYRAARDDVRSEVAAPVVHSGELLGVVNFEGTLERPDRAGPGRPCRDGRPARCRPRSGRRASTTSDASGCTPSSGCSTVSRALVADLDRPRIVASIVDAVAELLAADVVALFSRGDGRRLPARGRRRLPRHGDRPRGPAARAGWSDAPSSSGSGSMGSRRSPPGRPSSSTTGRAGRSPHAAMALPIEVDDEVAAVLFVTRIGPDRAYSALERGIADLLTAQVAIALQNADLHARVAESALRDPLTGLLNRRFFDEAVEAALANARRAAQSAEPDRPRSRPLLGRQQRVWPRRRRCRPAAGRACHQGRRPRGRRRRPLRRRGVRRHRAGHRWRRRRRWPPNGSARRSRPRARSRSTGGSCRSRSRPASPASSTRPTAAASSARPTQPSSQPSEQAGTESADLAVLRAVRLRHACRRISAG